MPRASCCPTLRLPHCSHALPHGNPQLAEDGWKLFWDSAQDLYLLPLLLTTAEMPLCRSSISCTPWVTSPSFFPALLALPIRQPIVRVQQELFISEVCL